MKKKLICLLLSLCLCAGLVPMTAAAEPYPAGTVVIPLTAAGVPDGDGGEIWSYDAAGGTLTLNAGHAFAVNGVCSVRVICKGTIVGGTYDADVDIYNGGIVSGGLFYGKLLEKLGARIEDADFPVTFALNGGSWAAGYDAPQTYSYKTGLVLPEATALSNGTLSFDGWYDSAAFDGEFLTAIPAKRTGRLTLYARFADGPATWQAVGELAQAGTDYALDAEGNFTIYSAGGLAKLANLVNAGDDFSGKTVTLANDIDLLDGGVYQYAAGTVVPRNSWIPLSAFGGAFEGGGHKIENLYVQTLDRHAGLFDNNYGAIRDLEIAGGSVAIRKLTHAGFYAGGVAARSSGTIERCVNRADISANDDNQVASSGSNALNLGGIVGFVGTSLLGAAVSAVTDCVNFGAVRNLGSSNVCEVSAGGIAGYLYSGMISGKTSLISGCVNRGSVSAPNPTYSVWAGGIVGTAAGNSAAVTATAASCENRGSVSSGFAAGGIAGYVNGRGGARVYNSYNTGAVSGGEHAGGIAGLLYYSGALAENCYSRGTVSGSGNAGGVIGLAAYGTARKCYYLDAAAAGTCGKETSAPTIADCADFTHSASGCTLNVAAGSPNDLLTVLQTWVRSQSGAAYRDWMADTQDENYPVFEVLYTVTVENGAGSGSYKAGDTVNIQANAPAGSQIFAGWTSADGVLFADSASAGTSFVMPDKDVTVTATYRQPPAPAVEYYTLRFETNGGSEVPSLRRAGGSRVSLNQTTARAGYVFTGWYLDAALTQRAGTVTLDRDKIVYAGWRRDAADPDDTGVSERLDTGAHEKYLTGYPDGSFRPDSTITRAEAAAVVNRMLARSGDENYIRTHTDSLARFADLAADHWAYFEIMEAANGHDYDRPDGREHWKQT